MRQKKTKNSLASKDKIKKKNYLRNIHFFILWYQYKMKILTKIQVFPWQKFPLNLIPSKLFSLTELAPWPIQSINFNAPLCVCACVCPPGKHASRGGLATYVNMGYLKKVFSGLFQWFLCVRSISRGRVCGCGCWQ